ncbi:MAG: FAD binding domain-containing protein [Pseudomonadota bacterium]
MKPFRYAKSGTFIAGGTTLVDLMKLGVVAPETLVDLADQPAGITLDAAGLRIEAGATMAAVAAHPGVAERFPAVAQALQQAASPQIRNMATIGGNLLQRTRCTYFRDKASACNKRDPGSGCSAIGGDERGLAVLGRSPSCIANYAGDLAVALVAHKAEITVLGRDGKSRQLPIGDLHRLPADRPHIEHGLAQGERIAAVWVPDQAWSFSTYVKLRDRASYAFALASAAACLRMAADGLVVDASLALGGMAAKPWPCPQAAALLVGHRLSQDVAEAVADRAYEAAEGDPKLIAVGKAAIVSALDRAARSVKAASET